MSGQNSRIIVDCSNTMQERFFTMPKRSDSSHVQTEIMNKAAKGVTPPDCVVLREKDLPFWKAITQARHDWTVIDLIHAANLSRCLADIEEETKALHQEGTVIMGGKNGTAYVKNPRADILETYSRRAMAISAKIQVHAAATQGESKQAKAKNTAKREAIEAFEDEDDNLLARPFN